MSSRKRKCFESIICKFEESTTEENIVGRGGGGGGGWVVKVLKTVAIILAVSD